MSGAGPARKGADVLVGRVAAFSEAAGPWIRRAADYASETARPWAQRAGSATSKAATAALARTETAKRVGLQVCQEAAAHAKAQGAVHAQHTAQALARGRTRAVTKALQLLGESSQKLMQAFAYITSRAYHKQEQAKEAIKAHLTVTPLDSSVKEFHKVKAMETDSQSKRQPQQE